MEFFWQKSTVRNQIIFPKLFDLLFDVITKYNEKIRIRCFWTSCLNPIFLFFSNLPFSVPFICPFQDFQSRIFFFFYNPIQARLFYRLKVQRGGGGGFFRDPLMISGAIKARVIKLCTRIVLLEAYQNTKINFQNYDLWRHNDVITK